MKMKISYAYFFMFLLILSLKCEKLAKTSEVYQKYYFIQKLYPGNDFIASLKLSKYDIKLKYFTLNKNMLYYSKSVEKKNKIEGNYFINDRFSFFG